MSIVPVVHVIGEHYNGNMMKCQSAVTVGAHGKVSEGGKMTTPLTRTFSPTHPYIIERHDQEDGSITYEIWDYRPDTYRRLCSINEWNDGGDEDAEERPLSTAKTDAELIARALNLMNGGLP